MLCGWKNNERSGRARVSPKIVQEFQELQIARDAMHPHSRRAMVVALFYMVYIESHRSVLSFCCSGPSYCTLSQRIPCSTYRLDGEQIGTAGHDPPPEPIPCSAGGALLCIDKCMTSSGSPFSIWQWRTSDWHRSQESTVIIPEKELPVLLTRRLFGKSDISIPATMKLLMYEHIPWWIFRRYKTTLISTWTRWKTDRAAKPSQRRGFSAPSKWQMFPVARPALFPVTVASPRVSFLTSDTKFLRSCTCFCARCLRHMSGHPLHTKVAYTVLASDMKMVSMHNTTSERVFE